MVPIPMVPLLSPMRIMVLLFHETKLAPCEVTKVWPPPGAFSVHPLRSGVVINHPSITPFSSMLIPQLEPELAKLSLLNVVTKLGSLNKPTLNLSLTMVDGPRGEIPVPTLKEAATSCVVVVWKLLVATPRP